MSRETVEKLKKRIHEQEKLWGHLPSGRKIEEKAQKIAEEHDRRKRIEKSR